MDNRRRQAVEMSEEERIQRLELKKEQRYRQRCYSLLEKDIDKAKDVFERLKDK